MSLELANEKPSARRVCRVCGQPSERVCVQCGIDLETGDLVAPPAEREEGPARDGSRPERRRLVAEAVFAEIPRTNKALLRRGLIELSHGAGGWIVCLVMVTFALSFREIPVVGEKIPWSGQLLATFVLSFLLVEKARSAREGQGGTIGASGAFDPSALGGSLFAAFFLLPILVGVSTTDSVFRALLVVPFAFLFPALVGALSCDGWAELAPNRMLPALWRSPEYARTTVWVAFAAAVGLIPVWVLDGSGVWRAPLAALGLGLAGSLCGLMRKDAETVRAE